MSDYFQPHLHQAAVPPEHSHYSQNHMDRYCKQADGQVCRREEDHREVLRRSQPSHFIVQIHETRVSEHCEDSDGKVEKRSSNCCKYQRWISIGCDFQNAKAIQD